MVSSMRAKQHLPEKLRKQARYGLLSVQDLEDAGVGRHARRRLVAEGRLHLLTPGQYSLSSPTPKTLAHVGLRVAGADAAVGGWHGLHMLGMRIPQQNLQQPVTVWVPNGTKKRPRAGWRFREDGYGRLRRMLIQRTLEPGDIVLDLCSELDVSNTIGLCTDAIRDRWTSPQRLNDLLDARLRHRHRTLISELMEDAQEGAESPLEHRYVRGVERPHGLPRASRQVRVGPNIVDGWYREWNCAIEMDGWRFHKDRVQSDARADADRAALGITTLRFGWDDIVVNPCRTAHRVASVLQRNGWDGHLRRCPSCP